MRISCEHSLEGAVLDMTMPSGSVCNTCSAEALGVGLFALMSLASACSDDRDVGVRGGLAGSGSTAAANGSANPTGLLPTPTAASVANQGANGCAPGHYVGSFAGTYNSAAWGNGSVPLSIEAVASMGQPGLEFWLEKDEAPCPNVEFCPDYTVKGGKIRGFANPFSDPNGSSSNNGFVVAVRFEIDFGGQLQCSTGQFMGLLQNGCYDVATILFRFEGTAPATYDRASSSFTQGQWSVKEQAMNGVIFPPDQNIGGMGTWGAKVTSDGAQPVAADMGLCHSG
jgi:hypothetical protein